MTLLAERARRVVESRRGADFTERRMFGGVGFMVGGNLACGASGRGRLVRVDPDQHDALLALPGAETMLMRGREMRGWLRVAPSALDDDARVAAWVARGVDYAASLPAKSREERRPSGA